MVLNYPSLDKYVDFSYLLWAGRLVHAADVSVEDLLQIDSF